jgi:hypothetical protein
LCTRPVPPSNLFTIGKFGLLTIEDSRGSLPSEGSASSELQTRWPLQPSLLAYMVVIMVIGDIRAECKTANCHCNTCHLFGRLCLPHTTLCLGGGLLRSSAKLGSCIASDKSQACTSIDVLCRQEADTPFGLRYGNSSVRP